MHAELIGGRFRLHRLLGSGTMGQVWLATDERLQRPVAVKVVLPDGIDTSLTLRLEREARAAAAVQHANVVRVFDYLDDGTRTLIVMEYVEGETLADRIARVGPLPFDDAVEFAAQVCDGLEAAHRLKLVHRDLKPANVIITDEGLAKILDFGIAKRTGHTEATLTQTGAVLGTPQYMAPEQLGGEEIDARADVHAAGLMLYEMLTGRSAFGGGTIAQLMFQLVTEPPDLTLLASHEVPADVIAIIARALQKQRDDRWPDARSMAEALRVGLYGDVIRTRRTPTPSGLRTIMTAGAQVTPRQTPIRTLTATADTAAPRSASLATMLVRLPPPKARRAVAVVSAIAVVAALSLSRIVSGLAEPASTAAPPVIMAASSVSTPALQPTAPVAPSTRETADAAEAAAENQLRLAFAAAVQSKWRLFSRPVSAELGAGVTKLRADFSVRVDRSGRLIDVRPVSLSGVSTFDENAAAALQEVDRIKVGSARSAAGWGLRVQFLGMTVRVRK